jgi:hypothetical protein
VLIGEYHRAEKNSDDDGLYLVDTARLVLSYNAFFSSTIQDPDPNGQDHVNDRVGFDGRLFGITSFLPEGRVASFFLTITVDLIQITQADMNIDGSIEMFSGYVLTS